VNIKTTFTQLCHFGCILLIFSPICLSQGKYHNYTLKQTVNKTNQFIYSHAYHDNKYLIHKNFLLMFWQYAIYKAVCLITHKQSL